MIKFAIKVQSIFTAVSHGETLSAFACSRFIHFTDLSFHMKWATVINRDLKHRVIIPDSCKEEGIIGHLVIRNKKSTDLKVPEKLVIQLFLAD